jgi:hypothetical protein
VQNPVGKIIKAKTTEGVVQVVDHLPHKLKALSSNSSSAKKILKHDWIYLSYKILSFHNFS